MRRARLRTKGFGRVGVVGVAALLAVLAAAGCKRAPAEGSTSSTGAPTEGAANPTSASGAPPLARPATSTRSEAPVDPSAGGAAAGGAASGDAASLGATVGDAAVALRTERASANSLLTRAPTRGRSIGHTSVVFALEADDGAKAAFKPASRRGPSRYKGEIAAHRLAIALGLSNVPPAFPRSFTRDELRAALGSGTAAGGFLTTEILERDGRIAGALIPWVDALAFLPLEADPLRADVRRWLTRGHDIPAGPMTVTGSRTITFEPKTLAAETSTMAIFDLLTGNWDRWSGANVGFDRERGTLLFVDNDGAFFENPPKNALAANVTHLEGIDRFSRAVVERLRALDDDALARAIGEETPGTPLLSERALAGVRARRDEARKILDAKIAARGEGETLFFP